MQSIVSPKHILVWKLKVELLVYLYLIISTMIQSG